MKRKRKSIALLLALIMCLSLLSACGADNTPDTGESPASVNTSAEQQPADEKEEQPSPEPEQEVPEETEEPEETAEPEPEEVEEQNNAGTEFLALLQEEYENGFFQGEGPKHTYYAANEPFIYNGVVYIPSLNNGYGYGAYDIASKEFNVLNDSSISAIFIDGNFFNWGNRGYSLFDRYSLECVKTINNDNEEDFTDCIFFDKGILFRLRNGSCFLFSYNHEKIAEISAPQHEIEHRLIEDMEWSNGSWFAVDGTVYTKFMGDDSLYRLNTDTYEWENIDAVSVSYDNIFFGKYICKRDGIYDRVTGEQVFEYGELYQPDYDVFCIGDYYFGGDKYLGYKDFDFRWVNLTDLSMSESLPFPPKMGAVSVIILDDTYCIYKDEYGWFLWNYNDGTEEMIVMFDN